MLFRRFSFSSIISNGASNSNYCTAIAVCSNSKNWIASNHLYKRHPRLQRLEACRNSPWLFFPMLAYTIISGLIKNSFVASRVLHLCCSLSPPASSSAAMIFNQLQRPNLFSWNTMIKSFAESENHCPSIAISLYLQMLYYGFLPDKYTYPVVLMACRSPSTSFTGRLIHTHSLVLGLTEDSFVQTALVNMYLRMGDSVSAQLVFDRMNGRDVVSWTGLISGLVDCGEPEQALEVFKALRKDPFIKPTVPTMISAVAAAADLGALNQTSALHGLLEKTGLMGDTFVGNSLINSYAKCGAIVAFSRIFHVMKDRDLLSWTAVISGLSANGMSREALVEFASMISHGVFPDEVTFVAVLSACSHAGLVKEGLENFEMMQGKYSLVPGLKHYGCMVDLFSRAGLLHRAFELVSAMPMKPSLAVLGALLSACRASGEVKLAETVGRMIFALGVDVGGGPIMLSGMYASEGRWEEAAVVRKMVGEEDVGRHASESWIEVEGVIYRFMVQDGTKPGLREIASALDGFAKDGCC
ncbi:pentatricopeptide repeat-containing protein At2g20540-like [Wolffia australiana]